MFIPPPTDDEAPAPDFGDNVRVRSTPDTQAAGYAGRTGQVLGSTQPSSTGVRVIGDAGEDYALVVSFDGAEEEEAWFAPAVLELVDHGAGMEIGIDSASGKKWVRNASGGWDEVRGDAPAPTMLQRLRGLFR